jgi:thymidylate synthase (FAD)
MKNKYYRVLDHGFVSLKDYMGDDSSIVQAARVSYGQGTKVSSDDRTLIRYLLRNKHTTPFEMVEFKFHLSMPIHANRQHVRHRMSTTNEYSARYSEVPEVIYDLYDYQLQSKDNKQGRNELVLDSSIHDELKQAVLTNQERAFNLYGQLLEQGVAREVARMHLPLNSYTYLYWKIDLHNLLHYLKLRCDSHAQYEIRQFAHCMASIVKEICPVAFEAWYDYSFTASNFTRIDKILLHALNFIKNKQIHEPEWDRDFDYKSYIKGLADSMSPKVGKRELEEFWAKLDVPEPTDFDISKYEEITNVN